MVRLELDKWEQSLSDLHDLATHSVHARTRERFFALYQIASGAANGTSWARQINRSDETLLQWLHNYNQYGPDSLIYHRTGGRPSLFKKNKSPKLSKQ